MEQWKWIAGFHGMYQVSSLGKIRSVERVIEQSNGKLRKFPEKIKSPSDNKYGYLGVNLFQNQKCTRVYVHRAVALAFIENDSPETKTQVNHKDGNKLNNKVENLEWVTPSENCIHAIENNLYKQAKGEQCPNAKIKEQDVLQIRSLFAKGMMQKDIAKMFGLKRQAITKIVNRQRWKHI